MTETYSYSSVADFVDEVEYLGKVLVNATRVERAGAAATVTTYEYDAQRRLTQTVMTNGGGCGTLTTTVTARDSRGRWTAGTARCDALTLGVDVSYNDTSRTMTISYTNYPSVKAQATNFTSYYWPAVITVTTGTYTLTTTNSVQSTAQVCK